MQRHRCPHCFEEFTTGEYADGVEFACKRCGNDFTLGEARRGRPDPDPALTSAAARIAELTARIERLEAWRAESEADAAAQANGGMMGTGATTEQIERAARAYAQQRYVDDDTDARDAARWWARSLVHEGERIVAVADVEALLRMLCGGDPLTAECGHLVWDELAIVARIRALIDREEEP